MTISFRINVTSNNFINRNLQENSTSFATAVQKTHFQKTDKNPQKLQINTVTVAPVPPGDADAFKDFIIEQFPEYMNKFVMNYDEKTGMLELVFDKEIDAKQANINIQKKLNINFTYESVEDKIYTLKIKPRDRNFTNLTAQSRNYFEKNSQNQAEQQKKSGKPRRAPINERSALIATQDAQVIADGMTPKEIRTHINNLRKINANGKYERTSYLGEGKNSAEVALLNKALVLQNEVPVGKKPPRLSAAN